MADSLDTARPTRSRGDWIRLVAYWAFTLVIAWEMAAGGLWDLFRIEYVRVILKHLGYPAYLLTLIGIWKIPCAAALVSPRWLRLKEWAYAGAIFNYTGAAASHLAVGDGPGRWAGPAVFAVLALASWALRPPARRLPAPDGSGARPVEWAVALLLLVAMLLAAYFSLPQGPPPGYGA
ncbi:MAG: DoxX family protein [Myxococcales bacterium]